MKVLIYTNAFAPRIGGVETYVMLLARGLSEHGQQKNQQTEKGAWKQDVTVVTSVPATEFDDGTLPFRVVRRPSMITLWRLLAEADVIQLTGPTLLPLMFGLLQRKPIVVEHHGYQAVCPNGLLLYEPTKTVCSGHFMTGNYLKCLRCNVTTVGWGRSVIRLLTTFLRRWLCKHVPMNVAVTDHVSRRIALPRTNTIYHGIPDPLTPMPSLLSKQMQVFPQSGVPPSRLADQSLCFSYVGRLVSEKGLPILLEAAQGLKKEGYVFEVKFIGDGPVRPTLEKLVDELGIRDRVSFTGFLQGERLQRLLEEINVLMMPSICEETAGLSAIEHMMRGRLVIATDIGGLGEVVDGAGLKFSVGDASELADCMRQALENRDLLTELGKKARERALEFFRLERMIDGHVTLYHRILSDQEHS